MISGRGNTLVCSAWTGTKTQRVSAYMANSVDVPAKTELQYYIGTHTFSNALLYSHRNLF